MRFSLPVPTLMLVTDRHRSRTPLIEAVDAAVAAGVDFVQLREPDLSDEEMRHLAVELLGLIGPDRLILNGRPNLSLELRIGLHLRDDQSPPDRPAADHDRTLRGRSFHGQPGARRADRRPDYLLAGNVFGTRTHPGRPPRGLGWLYEIVRRSDVPVLAIGGITAANVTSVMACGCHGVAVIDAILAETDPGTAAGTLRAALDRCLTMPAARDTPSPTCQGAERT